MHVTEIQYGLEAISIADVATGETVGMGRFMLGLAESMNAPVVLFVAV